MLVYFAVHARLSRIDGEMFMHAYLPRKKERNCVKVKKIINVIASIKT